VQSLVVSSHVHEGAGLGGEIPLVQVPQSIVDISHCLTHIFVMKETVSNNLHIKWDVSQSVRAINDHGDIVAVKQIYQRLHRQRDTGICRDLRDDRHTNVELRRVGQQRTHGPEEGLVTGHGKIDLCGDRANSLTYTKPVVKTHKRCVCSRKVEDVLVRREWGLQVAKDVIDCLARVIHQHSVVHIPDVDHRREVITCSKDAGTITKH